MTDFPRGGDIAATRAWLDTKGFTGIFVGWAADAILGLERADVNTMVSGENGLKLWGFLNTARATGTFAYFMLIFPLTRSPFFTRHVPNSG